jgi:polyisoprenoid-binding protein YceI
MKNAVLIFFTTLLLIHGVAQYKPVDTKSSVHFKTKTFGINVTGSFTGLNGNIFFDPNNLSDSKFDVTVDAATVNTDNSLRDNHLKDDPFFDVKNYPLMHFVSTRIVSSTKKGVLLVYVKMSIKNQTMEMSFPFTVQESANSYLFKGTFIINRKDYDVGETNIISNDVQVSLNVFATKELNVSKSNLK